MTLTVCCMTSDPGARVAALLGQLRGVADEIVVAVDSRLDPDRLGRYADVADRLLRYEFVGSSEQTMPWIVSQCGGDWILRVDGDEVLSAELIDGLPELVARWDVFQYWLPCRWAFPDTAHYLIGPPWQYSTPRLVRNDPATIWHGGLSHGRFDPVFPARYLEEGYYHLSLLVKSLAEREAKVAHYMSIASSHTREVLETDVRAFYLPEHDRRFGPTAVEVPPRDRARIEEVLAASGEERQGPASAGIPLFTWKEIERSWPRRPLGEEAYRGAIEPFERTRTLHAGERRELTVRVRNGGCEHWPGLMREPWIKLTHRWLTASGAQVGAPADTLLPAALAPGSSALMPLALEVPHEGGGYQLELELVHEDRLTGTLIRRFARSSMPIEVEPPAGEPPAQAEEPAAGPRRRWRLARSRG